jgi:hypothetical protein
MLKCERLRRLGGCHRFARREQYHAEVRWNKTGCPFTFSIDVTSVAVANSLEKIAIPQNCAILHIG